MILEENYENYSSFINAGISTCFNDFIITVLWVDITFFKKRIYYFHSCRRTEIEGTKSTGDIR